MKRSNSTMPNGIGESLLREPIEIKVSLDEISILSQDICSLCGVSGLRPAMQSMAVIGGGSVRGPDTVDKCDVCNGTGRR